MHPGATRRQRESALQASKTFTTSQQQLQQWSRRLLTDDEQSSLYSFYNEYQSTRQVHTLVYRCAQLLRTPEKRYLVHALRNIISPLDRAKFDKYVSEYGLNLFSNASKSPSFFSPSHASSSVGNRKSTTPTYLDLSSSWPASGFSTSPRQRPVSVSSERDRNAVRKLLVRRTSESEGLGFSFRGGAEHRVGLYVSGVDAGSAAEKSGLRAGMQLLKANDVSLEDATTDQAIRILKGSKKLRLSVIDRGMYPGTYTAHTQHRWVDPNGRLASPPPEIKALERRKSESGGRSEMRLLSNSDERKVNVLVKNGQKLGISIRGGIELGVGIYVSSVDENSVAENAGLRAGDQILDVNGESLLEATHLEATNMLKSQDHLMVMTIKDVGKIPHSTVKYNHSDWVYCNEQNTSDASLKDRSATLPARLRHKAQSTGDETEPYFREQPSAEFSTFKASDDEEKTRRESTIFKQGMGTQLVMKTTQVSTARAEIESKAQHILTEHELSSLHYYLSQYQDGHVHVDDLVTALRNILDTVEKASLVTDIIQIVTPRDLDRFESLMRETEMEVMRERRRLESINRMKAASMITDSPPVRRQAIPGSSQVDVRHSPSQQRVAVLPRTDTYSPNSSQDGDYTSTGTSPLIHQIATVAVVHKSATAQPDDDNDDDDNDDEDSTESENSSESGITQVYTVNHPASDTTSEVSDTAVLVAVNAIAAAADESDKEDETERNKDTEERNKDTEERNKDTEERNEDTRNETQDNIRADSKSNVDKTADNIVTNTRDEFVAESTEAPPVFHVPAPPSHDEDVDSEHDEPADKQETVVPVVQPIAAAPITQTVVHKPSPAVSLQPIAAAPITQTVVHKPSPAVSRRPPVFMPPPPPPAPEASTTPPIFHVPRPPLDEYIDSSDDETKVEITTDKQVDGLTVQVGDSENTDRVVSPDPQEVLQQTMHQRRKRINPGSIYIRERANRSISADSSTTEVSVDETWDPSFHDTSTLDNSITSTHSKQGHENVRKSDEENEAAEHTRREDDHEDATDEPDGNREATGSSEETEKRPDDVTVGEADDVLMVRGEKEDVLERQGMTQDDGQSEVRPSVVVSDDEQPESVEHRLEQHTDAQDNQPQPQPQQPTHPTPPQTTPDDTLTPTATSTPIKPSDPYTYKPSRSEIYGAPETPKQPTEDVYAIPNKLKKSRSTTPKPEPEREPKTVAGYTGLTGTIINVLVPKNKPRLGMSVNGGSNTKQKEIRLRDVQPNGCAHAVMPPLKLGQQILAVDHHSLKGLTHRQAVEMIKESFNSRRTEMELTIHEDDEAKHSGDKS